MCAVPSPSSISKPDYPLVTVLTDAVKGFTFILPADSLSEDPVSLPELKWLTSMLSFNQ